MGLNSLATNLGFVKGDKTKAKPKEKFGSSQGPEPATYGLTVHRSTD